MAFAGVDIGSTMTKVAVVDADDRMLASVIGPTGPEHRSLAHRVMEDALARAGLAFSEIDVVVATGYGRINVPFADRQITEITCHARGVSHLFPGARTVIDIGGQDCKGIRLVGGRVKEFVMNDRCAAGTGRFLEVIAEALSLDLAEIGELSLHADHPVKISNTCTIFAEQEVVEQLAEGAAVEDILAGLHESIAARIYGMVKRIKVEPEVVLTGGGAKNIGLVRALEACLELSVRIPPEPLITGALGAALLAREISRTMDSSSRQERKLERARVY